MFSQTNSIDYYKVNPVLIAPNLGKPQIITFPKDAKEDSDFIHCELLFISNYSSTDEFIKSKIDGLIYIEPIIRMNEETRRGIRGDPIYGKIDSVMKAPILPLRDPELILNYEQESPRGDSVRENIYADKNTYFLVKFSFKFTHALKSVIDREGFVLLDLTQKFSDDNHLMKINYHAIVVTNQTWENFTVIHATDLHIANRNDEILSVLLQKYDKSIAKTLLTIYDFISKRENEQLEDRFINPNNNLRHFIKIMNMLKQKKALDFIILTGDIIDFCIRSDGGDSVTSFDFPNTNWSVFYNIILNLPLTFRKDLNPIGLLPGEELLAPIFTLTGNHDYRSYHYDLRWGYAKVVNIRQTEIMYYQDVVPANPVSALYVNRKSLLGYNQYLNPYLDYWLKLGDHLFLMMDTGFDDAKSTKDLFMGSPAATGFSDDQIAFIENCIKYKAGPRGMRFAFFHAPNINPLPIFSMTREVRENYLRNGLKSLSDFKEDSLKKITKGEARADYYLNFKHGTIANNWDKTLKIFNDNRCIVFNGHTHLFFEARTEKTNNHSEFEDNALFVLKKTMQVPVAIFFDDYSIKYKDPNFFIQKMPFHLQTPSLGVADYTFASPNKSRGPFRVIKVKDNKIESFRIDFISNYPNLTGI
jgi:hypothetical protein